MRHSRLPWHYRLLPNGQHSLFDAEDNKIATLWTQQRNFGGEGVEDWGQDHDVTLGNAKKILTLNDTPPNVHFVYNSVAGPVIVARLMNRGSVERYLLATDETSATIEVPTEGQGAFPPEAFPFTDTVLDDCPPESLAGIRKLKEPL